MASEIIFCSSDSSFHCARIEKEEATPRVEASTGTVPVTTPVEPLRASQLGISSVI
jgi:hypothetical protein